MHALVALVTFAIAAALPVAGPPPASSSAPAGAPRVEIWNVPDGGIQPQASIDAAGTLHVLYFKGTPTGGDLYYVTRGASADRFSAPLRVNSIAGSVLASGSVRGGQLALGSRGRVHAAWYGAQEIPEGASKRRPVWHARLGADLKHFEPQVNVAVTSSEIDGATVAADPNGAVYVAWHGGGPRKGEAHRTVYVARSRDGGATFAPEQPVAQASTGACGCCGLRALVDASGAAHILYRSATDEKYRNAAWLTLGRRASAPIVLQTWKLDACPMSTFALAPAGASLAAAWETEQQIYVARLEPAAGTFSSPVAMEGAGGRKHPSIAAAADGTTVVAWTEGTGWARGGTLAWAALDRQGRRLAGEANAGAVPVWGLVAAIARPDGSFVILR